MRSYFQQHLFYCFRNLLLPYFYWSRIFSNRRWLEFQYTFFWWFIGLQINTMPQFHKFSNVCLDKQIISLLTEKVIKIECLCNDKNYVYFVHCSYALFDFILFSFSFFQTFFFLVYGRINLNFFNIPWTGFEYPVWKLEYPETAWISR